MCNAKSPLKVNGSWHQLSQSPNMNISTILENTWNLRREGRSRPCRVTVPGSHRYLVGCLTGLSNFYERMNNFKIAAVTHYPLSTAPQTRDWDEKQIDYNDEMPLRAPNNTTSEWTRLYTPVNNKPARQDAHAQVNDKKRKRNQRKRQKAREK